MPNNKELSLAKLRNYEKQLEKAETEAKKAEQERSEAEKKLEKANSKVQKLKEKVTQVKTEILSRSNFRANLNDYTESLLKDWIKNRPKPQVFLRYTDVWNGTNRQYIYYHAFDAESKKPEDRWLWKKNGTSILDGEPLIDEFEKILVKEDILIRVDAHCDRRDRKFINDIVMETIAFFYRETNDYISAINNAKEILEEYDFSKDTTWRYPNAKNDIIDILYNKTFESP